MPYDVVHRTNHVAQISIKAACKSAQSIRSAMNHNNRIGKEGSGPHIDKRRTFLNEDLLGNSQDEVYLNLINRISGKDYTKDTVPVYGVDEVRYVDDKKLKASKDRTNDKYDLVLAFEIETMYPGDMVWSKFDEHGNIVPLPDGTEIGVAEIAAEGKVVKDPSGKVMLDENGNEVRGKGYFKMPLNKKEFDEWCKATIEFAKDRFGDDNVVSAKLHMDEQTPHIHMMCTPLMKDEKGIERLNYRDMVGKNVLFNQIQDEYADAIAYIGYQRGERNSQRINNITTKEYKVRLAKEMAKEMPDTLDKAKEQIRDLRVRNFDLSERMREIKVPANKLQKTRNKLDEIEKENRRLKEQVQEQAHIIEQQRERIMLEENRKACIDEGLRIHPRQNAAEAYLTMEKQFLENGFEHKLSLGYTKEQLRYWEDRNHNGINDKRESINLDHNNIDISEGK